MSITYKIQYLLIALVLVNVSELCGQTRECIVAIGPEKAYFHDRVTHNGKVSYNPRKAYLITGDQVTINCQEKSENWIYVSFKNAKGVITSGFLKKTDLRSTPTNRLSKTETLRSLLGEHSLQSISGNSGANALFEYEKRSGRWSASGSALNGGMREGYKIPIPANDMNILNSMKISVSPDLTIRLLSANKIILTIPFIESGMDYKLKNNANSYGWPVPESLKPNTTFIDNELFLYANDSFTEDRLSFAIGYFTSEENIILISYNREENSFTVTVSGMNTVVYTFK